MNSHREIAELERDHRLQRLAKTSAIVCCSSEINTLSENNFETNRAIVSIFLAVDNLEPFKAIQTETRYRWKIQSNFVKYAPILTGIFGDIGVVGFVDVPSESHA